MKKILFFCLLFIIIPLFVISILVIDSQNQKFIFSRNTVVRVYRTKTDKIENVPLEEYIKGVVAGEMPISFNEEALKAQAVAARSYIMYKIVNNKDKNRSYDVVDTVLNQVYIDDAALKNKWGSNYDQYREKINRVVEDTAYQYITYNGKIADALFFSTSSGYTENSQDVFISKVHYLQSVESSWDAISPLYLVEKKFSFNDFCKKLHIDTSNSFKIKILDQTSSGRINKISINNVIFTGNEVVKLLNLRSVKFTINVSDVVTVTTKGYGHGVGMSQYGAEGMARNGYTYDQILKHYYTDTKIEKIK